VCVCVLRTGVPPDGSGSKSLRRPSCPMVVVLVPGFKADFIGDCGVGAWPSRLNGKKARHVDAGSTTSFHGQR